MAGDDDGRAVVPDSIPDGSVCSRSAHSFSHLLVASHLTRRDARHGLEHISLELGVAGKIQLQPAEIDGIAVEVVLEKPLGLLQQLRAGSLG
jgi:hypothetical protein